MRELPPPTPGPLLPWLLNVLAPTNRTRVKQLLQHGRVLVNGRPVSRHDHPLTPADRVSIAANGAAPRTAPSLTVVYEDDSLVVIDKPAGLLSVATDAEKDDTAFTRLAALLERRKAGRPFVVHRLDRGTSGLLLFAKTAPVRDRLQAGWEAVEKTYLAVTEGVPRPAEGVIENHLLEGANLRVRPTPADAPGAKRAASRFRVLGEHAGRALVAVELLTGRKHQIRVHLAGLGCPVVGDRDYGAKDDPGGRVCLHAWRLAFDHPDSDRRVAAGASPPPELWRAYGAPADQRPRMN
ncbi:RluA family pseudouridine synthase [Urbifossiella limnaea]|uniref:Ribosomal large subunit pseudouridine synthase A n=1 Tax=Urbifossiella limnaea TaxID=2528023 RepID=A0A517XTT2_9BACT|nr:RluA family pseudouridine synthase [Urbifossiella limnaea]QDU20921.1 Ribosomal large subunit pseudouridine synthase A [Urbifossiella limnaea]